MQATTSFLKPCPVGINLLAIAYILAGVYFLFTLSSSFIGLITALLLDVAFIATAYGLTQHYYHGWLAALALQGLAAFIIAIIFVLSLFNLEVNPINLAIVCLIGSGLYFSVFIINYLLSVKIKRLYGVAW